MSPSIPSLSASSAAGGTYRRLAARGLRHAPKETASMTAQTLPDNPNYCFVPAYDLENEV